MTELRSSAVFGKRSEPHTVIIARGDDIRHFTIRPWMAALAGSIVAAFAIGYLLATSYLVLRDDLIGATAARQARLQQSYEDRISALRAQVDRITSRQLLDQQLMESKVAELMSRQAELAQRDGRLRPLLERAGAAALPEEPPVPAAKPDLRAAAPLVESFAPAQAASSAVSALSRLALGTSGRQAGASAADEADRLFVTVNKSLRGIEERQLEKLRILTADAYETAETIVETLKSIGLPIDARYGELDVGGPLVRLDNPQAFDEHVEELDSALSLLDEVKNAAARFPISNPAPGRPVSSGFGVRKDPLLGTPAHHSGIDFRGAPGFPIRSSGAGTVVKAGWNGGYGRMVEVDHGHGITTRYAHMSSIAVKEGDRVVRDTVLGGIGSSGRSTGPHLHYEIRRNGKALNPVRFLKAGRKIGELL